MKVFEIGQSHDSSDVVKEELTTLQKLKKRAYKKRATVKGRVGSNKLYRRKNTLIKHFTQFTEQVSPHALMIIHDPVSGTVNCVSTHKNFTIKALAKMNMMPAYDKQMREYFPEDEQDYKNKSLDSPIDIS